ncbi:MAG: DUF1501 domain-containing protein [Chloroflexota bacterium]|nr:DUF1501 domain-containing protein [Chloroflexota bacterium]MDE2886387.1 DUF1501 domain-containing protein [Chloroflexota bacterium]
MLISRRQFLKTSMVAVPAAAAMPAVFSRAVAAAIHEQPSVAAPLGNRTLVIVQMAGGNDGLNTVVPANDRRYYELRGDLAIPQDDVLAIDGQAGFHPSLPALKELWDEGALAVVEGVGYPAPSFSHFESMDIWQTAQTGRRGYEGWLGRYLEGIAAEQEDVFLALVADKRMPRAMVTANVTVPLVESVDAYQLQDDPRNASNRQARTEALLRLYASSPGATRFGALLDNTLQAAQRSSDAVQQAHARYEPAVEYGESGLAQGLRLMAEAIDADLGLRVGHVKIGGFDTHAAQKGRHEALLAETADAMLAFYRDLQAHGHANDVVMMTWSEFGRRVTGNASDGTDHGSAGPMFVVGAPVAGGLYGERPSLASLEKDNLRFTTDFRQVYASVLEGWLGAPSEAVLGGRFERLPLFVPGAAAN